MSRATCRKTGYWQFWSGPDENGYEQNIPDKLDLEDTDERGFDRASSYCGKCWTIVTNASYLAKNSRHITGKCSEKHVIPASIYQRTCDRNCGHSSTWWLAYRRIEEQNRLFRQLLAA